MNTKRRSGVFAILVAVMMVFAMMPIMGGAVYADSNSEKTIDGVKYTLTVNDNGKKVVSVTGCDGNLTGAVEILGAVTFGKVKYSVASIGEYAFRGTAITSITIPAGVTDIGEGAFYDCQSLGTVTFAEGSKLKSIGGYAFIGTAITGITIPASVTSIGHNAFNVCESLGTVTFAKGSRLESIGGFAFEGTAITGITIPVGVTSIGGYAFQGTAITSITIPARVTDIRDAAFYNCKSLGTVTFAEGSKLESIGGNAFGKTAITSITIPAGVTGIGGDAFACDTLDTVYYVGTQGQWNGMSDRDSYWAGGRDIDVVFVDGAADVPAGKTIIYNGAEQTGVEAGEGYTLTGMTSATDAGSYTATAALANGYVWTDGTTADKTIVWRIGYKAVIPAGKNLIYDGTEQTGVEDGEGYTLTGTTSATETGSYTATAALENGYVWADRTTGDKTFVWRIGYEAAVPAGKNLTYNGTEQTGVEDGEGYILTGTTSATKAGSYKPTAILIDGYVWADGTIGPKTVLWKIKKATVKVAVPAGKTFTYNGKARTGVAAGNNYTLSGTRKATKAGTYTVKAALKTNANYTYKWKDGTTAAKAIKWKINKAANPLTIKAKTATVKGSTKGKKGTLKKTKTLAVTKVIRFTKKAGDKKTYVKKSGNKKITIAKKSGKVTVKQGMKKGTYKVTVKVKAKGNANYKASKVKTVTFKIIVK